MTSLFVKGVFASSQGSRLLFLVIETD